MDNYNHDTKEEWRVIPTHIEYAVSNLGRVMRVAPGLLYGRGRTHIGRILLGGHNGSGYATVNIKRKKVPIHQIVMLAFHGEPPAGQEVNHKDGNKRNPNLKNLEYVTRGQNVQHANDTGLVSRVGEKNGFATLTDSKVVTIKQMLWNGAKYKEIQEKFNISNSCVWSIKFGHTWGHI